MKKATHRKQALMIAIFLLAFTLSLFSFGTTPAAAGDVAGVSTHLFLTVLRDYDHDAAFSVTYTDALGTHTKPYHAGMEVTAWSPVTITCTNHHVYDWSIDADVQEATIVGVGGITYPGGTGIHVKGTNTIKAFATNFGLHYINIVVILGEGNDNGGDNGGGDNGVRSGKKSQTRYLLGRENPEIFRRPDRQDASRHILGIYVGGGPAGCRRESRQRQRHRFRPDGVGPELQ